MTTTRRLSRARRIGNWTVAAIEETATWASAAPGRVAGRGSKFPLAILIGGPRGVLAQAPSGATLAPDDIDALLPGAFGTFAAMAASGPQSDQEEEDR